MKTFWVGQAFALTAVLIFSSELCAQTLPKTDTKKETAPAAQNLPRTSDGVPDFSGVWGGHMPPSARKWAGYSFTGGYSGDDGLGKSAIRTDEAILGSTCRRGINRSRQSNDGQ